MDKCSNFLYKKLWAKKALIELQVNNAKHVLASIFKNLVDVDPTQSGRKKMPGRRRETTINLNNF